MAAHIVNYLVFGRKSETALERSSSSVAALKISCWAGRSSQKDDFLSGNSLEQRMCWAKVSSPKWGIGAEPAAATPIPEMERIS